ncbi:MAG: hypothetical protein ACOCYZ_02920 [Halococcoides sp.]
MSDGIDERSTHSVKRRRLLRSVGVLGALGVTGSVGVVSAAGSVEQVEWVEPRDDPPSVRAGPAISVDDSTVRLDGTLIVACEELTADASFDGSRLDVTIDLGEPDPCTIGRVPTPYAVEIELSSAPDTVVVSDSDGATARWPSRIVETSIERIAADPASEDTEDRASISVDGSTVTIEGGFVTGEPCVDPTIDASVGDGTLSVSIGGKRRDGGCDEVVSLIEYRATVDLESAPETVRVSHAESWRSFTERWEATESDVETTIQKTGESATATDDARIAVGQHVVAVEGTIVAPAGQCYDPTVAADTDGQQVIVTVGLEKVGEVCTQALSGVEYEARIAVPGTPDEVVVQYGDPDDGPTWTWPGDRSLSIEKTDGGALDPSDRASIRSLGDEIAIEGRLWTAHQACPEPTIATETDDGTLRVSIDTARPPGAGCDDAEGAIEYDARVSIEDLPETVIVEHVDRSFESAWSPTMTDDGSIDGDASIDVDGRTISYEGVLPTANQACPEPWIEVSEGETVQIRTGTIRPPDATCLPSPGSLQYSGTVDLGEEPSEVVLEHVFENTENREWTWPATDLPPVDGRVPGDVDDDGLHEDFSENGKVDFPDVNAFFQHSDTAAVQDHPDAYDFTDDGSVDLQDVLALFEMV